MIFKKLDLVNFDQNLGYV